MYYCLWFMCLATSAINLFDVNVGVLISLNPGLLAQDPTHSRGVNKCLQLMLGIEVAGKAQKEVSHLGLQGT